MKTVLSLCDYSNVWSRAYEEAGYHVLRFDLARGEDVRLLRRMSEPVHGILMAPPCTHFSRAGAWAWNAKGDESLIEGLSVVDACLRAVVIYRPDWWALENPVGRLKDFLGEPVYAFDPYQFGDPWTKKTWLWGHFTPPMPLFSPQPLNVVAPSLGDVTTRIRGKRKRSETPPGFARAFFEANP